MKMEKSKNERLNIQREKKKKKGQRRGKQGKRREKEKQDKTKKKERKRIWEGNMEKVKAARGMEFQILFVCWRR